MATTGTTAEPLRYLALGDSYTIGESVDEAGRWPVQLADRLRKRGIALAPPAIVARTGWTTDELDRAIDEAAPGTDHALVSLLIGVNNQYRGRPLPEYREEFTALLDRAIGFAGGDARRVFVLSIPDWGVTPFAAKSGRDRAQIARELDAYNDAARTIAQARGVAFVDITAISRGPGASAGMLAEDGLHPSASQYALWAAAAEPVVARLLGR
ncbi:MAG TPA: SGNH/GDSL hydrolase family protein [Xanthomonadales bacterium]|nr:SGNH/GDSL hydrolase family protein [Xanthomonadales bacterium]